MLHFGRFKIDLDAPYRSFSITDTICPFRAYMVYNTPLREFVLLRKRDIAFSFVGYRAHGAVEKQLKEQGCETEVVVSVCDKHFKIDAICGDEVIEIKSVLKNRGPDAEIAKYQLKAYLALSGKRCGHVVGLNGNMISLCISEEEAKKIREYLERVVCSILRGEKVVEKNPGLWCSVCRFKEVCGQNGRKNAVPIKLSV